MAARSSEGAVSGINQAGISLQNIVAIDPDSIVSDPRQAETLFIALQQASVGDIDEGPQSHNVTYWKHLFEVTQAVLKVKGEDASLALEALRMQEQSSQDNIQQLQRQLQRSGQRSAGRGGASDPVQEDLAALEKRSSKLQKHLRRAEMDLAKEQAEKDTVREECQRQQAELERLSSENKQMKGAITDYQAQLQTYRASVRNQHGFESEERQRQKLRNVQLSGELDSLRKDLAENNTQLVQERDRLAADLKVATTDMLEATEEIVRLKAALKQSDEIVKNMKDNEARMEDEMAEKEHTYQKKAEEEDAMMAAIDEKLEDWKQVLDERNVELVQCKETISRQKKELLSSTSDKTNHFRLAKIAENRAEEIDALNDRLMKMEEEATMNSEKMELMKKQTGDSESQRRITELEALNSQLADQASHDRQLCEQAAQDAAAKDQQLAASLTKINALVQGHYGLTEAMKEIQELKTQVSLRDDDIKGFVTQVNELQVAVNSLEDENSELCQRLGIDRTSSEFMHELQFNKRVTNEQEKAKARHLAREVERLESERVELKRQLLIQAMQRGERAVQLGLTTEDLIAVEEFADLLRNADHRNEPRPDPVQVMTSQHSLKEWKEELKHRDEELEKVRLSYKQAKSSMTILSREKAELEKQHKALADENLELSRLLKDVAQQVKAIESLPARESEASKSKLVSRRGGDEVASAVAGTKLMSNGLEELLALWHARHSPGSQEGVAFQLRAQIDQLVGKSAQVGDQLRQSQQLCEQLTSQKARQELQIETLESDIAILRQAGAQISKHHNTRLPEEIPLTSAEIIASLNKQLLHTLHQLSIQEEQLRKSERSLSAVQSQTASILHQQGLLYQQYESDKSLWTRKEEQIKKDKAQLEERHVADQLTIARLERMDEARKDKDASDSYLSELSQRVTDMEITERKLRRQLSTVMEDHSHLTKDYNMLKNDHLSMEAKCQERISALQQYRILSEARLGALSQRLENSSPLSELTKTQTNLNELSAKYRALLNQQAQHEDLQGTIDELKSQSSRYQTQVEEQKAELLLLKERASKAEHLLKTAGASDEGKHHLRSSQQVSLLEMKALSAEQKAELANQKMNQFKSTVAQVEERNFQLEKHFEELTKLNVAAQQQESNIRQELNGCIPASEATACREQIQRLMESEAALQADVTRLQNELGVLTQHGNTVELWQTVHQAEMNSLRTQLIENTSRTDERTLIGKLHRHIVALEVREATAMHKLHQASSKVTNLEASLAKLQEESDAKTASLHQCKMSAISKQCQLRHTIQMLRRQYSGCVTLAQQEQYTTMLRHARAARCDAEKKLKEAVDQQVAVDDQLAELQIRLASVQELLGSLQDGTHASKVVLWHGKMEEVRLENLRQLRLVDKMKAEIKSLQLSNDHHEEVALQAEESLVKEQQQHEAELMSWERREAELEDAIHKLQLSQERMLESANELGSSQRLVPDPSQPVATQLEQAVGRLKHQALRCSRLQDHCDALEKDKRSLDDQRCQLEQQLIRKEKVETELRIRLTGHPSDVETTEDTVSTREKEAIKKAQRMIESLKEQLQQKENVLLKYQSRLVQVQEECAATTDEQKEQIALLSRKVKTGSDDVFRKLRQAAVESTRVADPPLPTQKQLDRLRELEDIVSEQDKTIAALLARCDKEKQRHGEAEASWTLSLRNLKQQMESQLDSIREDYQRTEHARKAVSEELSAVQEQLEVTRAELLAAQEAAQHAPNRTMKVLVEKLKQQLAAKEQQHQALTQALAQLRSDFTNMAEQQIQDKMASSKEELNIQKLINDQTAKLKTHIDDLQAKLDHLSSQSEKHSKQELLFKEKIAALQETLHQKEIALGRQDKSLQSLRKEKERWLGREKELLSSQASKPVRRPDASSSRRSRN
eukprot:scpid6697/ scgid11854/ Centrosomal protein of 290 kDa; Bardet-Biedl syndrome 14 protein homolog; Nephrocystin-6